MSKITDQSFVGDVIENLFINVNRILAKSARHCQWELPESAPGACDGGELCGDPATIFDSERGIYLCPKHDRLARLIATLGALESSAEA